MCNWAARRPSRSSNTSASTKCRWSSANDLAQIRASTVPNGPRVRSPSRGTPSFAQRIIEVWFDHQKTGAFGPNSRIRLSHRQSIVDSNEEEHREIVQFNRRESRLADPRAKHVAQESR